LTQAAGARSQRRQASESRQKLRLWLRLLRTSRSIEAELRKRLRHAFGETLPRFDVMAALARAPAGMTMSELSRLLVVSNGNVTGLVDALVADRLVVRVPLKEDRRSMLVKLTSAGGGHFAAMAAEHEGWIEEIFAGLAAKDAEHMTELLANLHGAPRREGAEP
jgi:DNA-binding MarR family transcriptional regulator